MTDYNDNTNPLVAHASKEATRLVEEFYEEEEWGRNELQSLIATALIDAARTPAPTPAPTPEAKPLTEDEAVFGVNAWVWCQTHQNAHQTGWCGVVVRRKVGLGVATAREALAKCRELGLALYADSVAVEIRADALDNDGEE